MCWNTRIKSCAELKVAKDNIPVTKIVWITEDRISAYFMQFDYIIGEVYHTEIGTLITLEFMGFEGHIDKGFHSYTNESIKRCNNNSCYVYLNNSTNRDKTCYHKDRICYHNYNNETKLGIMSCIIPKGSKYYKNEVGEIVSDTIKPIYCFTIK